MAKTVYLKNYAGIEFGYEVDTAVASAEEIRGGDPPEAIGTKAYPESIQGIQTNQLLEIAGAGEITVSGIGSDENGDFFTYSKLAVPDSGAAIRTPWQTVGTLLVTRDDNSVALTYSLPVEHDLYFGTQKTADSGMVSATLDGRSLGSFDLSNPTTIPASVLLQQDVAPGRHTMVIQAVIEAPAAFVYFHGFELLEHLAATGGEYLYLGPAGTMEDSLNNFVGNWNTVAGFAWTTQAGASVSFHPQLGAGGKVKARLQKTPDSAIVGVYVNGELRRNLDLYQDPGSRRSKRRCSTTRKGMRKGCTRSSCGTRGRRTPRRRGFSSISGRPWWRYPGRIPRH